ncbi:MAG: transcription antitermination factor NusB [Chitinophagales bacterium]
MLSRRIIRVKAMQVLFSSAIGKDISPVKLEQKLREYIKEAEHLYHVYLLYLVEICNYSLIHTAKQESKLLENSRDENTSTALAENDVIRLIGNNKEFKDYIAFNKINDYINPKIVKSLYEILIKKDKYLDYIKIANKTKTNDIDMLRNIIKKVMGASLELEEDLAENFINIEDDSYYALMSIQKTLKSFIKDADSVFLHKILLLEDNSEIQVFANDIIENYFEYEEDFEDIIKPKLKNWDMDRIAVIDMVILKMAICEFKCFASIPIKVTINEYVDIAKEYSTDKSKDFINGILDKIMKFLKESGGIKKQGRGLIN